MKKPETQFETLLANYPVPVQELASGLRQLILAILPQPIETIDGGNKLVGYGFGPRYADMVCTLIPSRKGVKLGLAYGASLPDPGSLLAGAGRVHRHVNFTTLADLKRPGVNPLLKAALAAQQSRAKSR